MSNREQELLDRIAELEDILGLTQEFPAVVALKMRGGLAPVQTRLLGLLMRRKFVPWSCAHDALYGGRGTAKLPEMTAISSVIKYLRKRLKPLGVSIETVYGEGFFMTEMDKQRLRAGWPETDRLVA